MSLLGTYLRLFRGNPALARLLGGEFISGIGDWLYLVAILVVVYAESGSPVLLGVMGAARILPYVVLSVPAGIVVDRYDRRMVLLVTDVARGLLMLALALLVTLGAPVVAIVAVSILAACFSTFFGPAISALLPTLVDESELGPANSAWATLDNLAFIIGPALAGLLIAVGGLSLAFLLNAASFAVVAAVLWWLPGRSMRGAQAEDDGSAPAEPPMPEARSAWRDLVGPLIGPFVLDSATSLVGGGMGVLTVVIAVEVLHAGEAGAGYLNAGIGVGGVAAGVAAGALLARRPGLPLLVGGVVTVVGLVWLAFASDLAIATLAIGVGAAGALLLDVVNTTLVQRLVPDRVRGRAMGVLQTSSALFFSAGSLLLPVLADVVGVAPVIVGSGVVIVGAVAVALLLVGGVGAAKLDPARARVMGLGIFAGLPRGRLEAAARATEIVAVGAGQAIVRQGDEADRFYVIDEGTFAVTQRPSEGPEVQLRQLGPGDVFGEIGLLERTPRTATVTAISAGRLLAMSGAAFLELVGSGPGLSTRLLDLYRGALAR